MRSNIALRLRRSMDRDNFESTKQFSINAFSNHITNSPKRIVNKTPLRNKYQILQKRKSMNDEQIANKEKSLRKLEYFNSVNITLESQQIKEQDKSIQYKRENRQKSEDKILVYDVFREEYSKHRDQQDKNLKKNSLPVLKKRSSPSPQLQDSQMFLIPPMPQISELNYTKYIPQETSKIQNREQKEYPESTERILDLLLLNTCDLKKVFQQQRQKNKRKIIIQSRIPQDFFNILKQC